MSAGRTIKRSIRWIKWTLIIMFVWSIAGLGFFNGAATPFYRVKQEYARVLTEVDGDRRIEERVGYHWRVNTIRPNNWIFHTKEYSKRVEFIYLDNERAPHEMQAADKIKFQGAGVWTYKIVDLHKFGIRMGEDAKAMLTAELNGIAKAKIQAHDVEYIVTRIDLVNDEVNLCDDIRDIEEKYGVDIISFRLTHATYPREMNEKTAEAKGIKIKAEATRDAAEDLAKAREKFGDADRYRLEQIIKGAGVTTEEGRQRAMDILERLNFQDMLRNRPPGENTYIFTERGSGPNVTLPPPGRKQPAAEEESRAPAYPAYRGEEDRDDHPMP